MHKQQVLFMDGAKKLRAIKEEATQEIMNTFACEVRLKIIVVTERKM